MSQAIDYLRALTPAPLVGPSAVSALIARSCEAGSTGRSSTHTVRNWRACGPSSTLARGLGPSSWWARISGHRASFANLSPLSSKRLYALLRRLQPEVLVETGVCNGVSSAVILHALHANERGHLYSVDLPEFAGVLSTEHWEGKGAV